MDAYLALKQLKKSCKNLGKTIEKFEHQIHSEEFIEQNITIAELKELIDRVHEDLKNRFGLLNRNDKAEIIKVIKLKEQTLMKNLHDMEAFLNQDLHVKGYHSSSKSIIITLGATIGLLAAIGLIIASVDTTQNSWTWPSLERLCDNLS